MPGRKLQKHAKQFFRHIDTLQSIALGAEVGGGGDESGPVERAGKFLPHLAERDIMGFVDHMTYIAGVDYFMQGRVSERTTWGDNLACRVVEGKAGRFPFGTAPRLYRVILSLKESRGPGHFSMSGSCDCLREQPFPRRDEPCRHVIALLVAWVRKPERFQPDKALAEAHPAEEDYGYDDEGEEIERRLELFEDELEETASSLHGVLSALGSTSRLDDMEFLQRLYSKLRLSLSQTTLDEAAAGSPVGEALVNRSITAESLKNQAPMSCQYSGALSSMAVTIFAMVDSKYGIGALGLFYSSLVSVTGKVLENLVAGVGTTPRRRAATGEPHAREAGADLPSGPIPRLPIPTDPTSASVDSSVAVPSVASSRVPTMPKPGAHGPVAQGSVRRSWDAVIEGLGS